MSEPTGVKMASIKKVGSIPKLKEYIIVAGKSGIKGLDVEYVVKGKWDSEYKTLCLNVSQSELAFLKTVMTDEERTNAHLSEAFDISRKITFSSVADYARSNNFKVTDEWLFENAWRNSSICYAYGICKRFGSPEKVRT